MQLLVSGLPRGHRLPSIGQSTNRAMHSRARPNRQQKVEHRQAPYRADNGEDDGADGRQRHRGSLSRSSKKEI